MTHRSGQAPGSAAAAADLRYDRVQISLHWLTALLVVTLYLLAQTWGFVQRGTPLRHEMQALHVSLGLTLAAVVVARIAWRHGPGRRLPPAISGMAGRAVEGMHYLLYALLVAVVMLGVTFRWANHDPLSFFGLFTIPAPYAFTHAQAHVIGWLHNLVATSIVILAGLHACAALFHHFVLRDGVLKRMLPQHRARPAPAAVAMAGLAANGNDRSR